MKRKNRVLQNTFEIQTRGSHKKAVSILTDTMDKMEGKPEVAHIRSALEPHYAAYISLNDAVGLLEGTYKGRTNLFESLIDEIKGKLRDWEGKIRGVFPEDSPTEIEIFPRKRTPFYDGTYEQRLGSIRILRDKLLEYTTDYPSLVPVQADVAAYYTLCNAARTTQQGKEGDLNSLRTQREAQRVITMNAYQGIVYGGLLTLFYSDLERIGDYIDFTRLYGPSDKPDIVVSGNVGANSQLALNLPDAEINEGTGMELANPINIPNSVYRAQYGSSGNAAFDPARSYVTVVSQSPPVQCEAADAGFDKNNGFTFLILYALNEQTAFRIVIEQ
jgi:hypothetical protein